MSGDAIYLDHAATTHLAPEIAQLMASLFQQPWANPASQHRAGREANAVLEDAKDRIKVACLGINSNSQLQSWQIVTTSGGTEANNLALLGLSAASPTPVYVAASEHPSVLTPATEAPQLGHRSRVVPLVGSCGRANIDVLEEWLLAAKESGSPHGDHRARPLVSIMLGNNETGIRTDIEQVSQLCRRYDAVLHCDVVQAIGKVSPAEFVPWVDAFTISAHKLHGPIGVGALVFRSSLDLQPLLFGGGQQLALRPGSESVVLVSALAAAIELAEKYRQTGGWQQITELRLHFESLLHDGGIGAQVIGEEVPRLPHTSCIAFPGVDRQALLMALDFAGVQCSSGSACASGSSQPSHVLTAMGLPLEWINGAIRFSFSRFTSREELEEAALRISQVVHRLRKRA